MGLLKQKEEIDSKFQFYIKDGDSKFLAAYINDRSGAICLFNDKIDSIEDSKALCQWYLNVCDEL